MCKAIYLFLCFLIAEINASNILAQVPGDKIDFNAIDAVH